MRVDYREVFPEGFRAMTGMERSVRAAALEPIVAINGWNRLAVGLRSEVTSLDGLDLPDGAGARSAPGSA